MKILAKCLITSFALIAATAAHSQLQVLWSHQANGQSVAFSPDGSRIVAGGTFGVSLWDVASGQLVRWIDSSQANTQAVAFSPDGTLIAAGQAAPTNQINVWRASDGALLKVLDAPDVLDIWSL